MCRIFSLHSLGRAKLSRRCPQRTVVKSHQARSGGCGLVDRSSPQAVDRLFIHSLCTALSTGDPQDLSCCAQRREASPHRCPLFGNATRSITGPSESRHTEGVGWAVGNVGKAGDGSGEKWPSPVHRVCRTFRRPQIGRVVHRPRPQAQWTKNRL
ncbi:hypothetical protein C1N81_24060 [Streptomyces sp. SGAir0957]